MTPATTSLVRVTMLAITVSLGSTAAAAEPDPRQPNVTPAELLERLRARDAAFDNYSLTFTEREPKRIDEKGEFTKRQFNNIRFGGQAEPAPESFPDPYDAVIVSRRTMVVRGDDVVLSSVWTTDHHGHPQLPEEPQIYKRQNHRVIALSSAGSDRILTIYSKDKDHPAPYPDFRWFYEMTLGVGFGRCLKSIESVEPAGGGWRVRGTARLWTEDKTTAHLVIDSNLIVRRAELEVDVQSHKTRIYVSSSGQLGEDSDTLIARTGEFQRVIVRTGPEDEMVDTVSHWELEGEQLEINLSDARYAALTVLDEKSAQHIIDQTRNKE